MQIDSGFYDSFKLVVLEALDRSGALVVPAVVASAIAAGVDAAGDRTFALSQNLIVCTDVSAETVKALKLIVLEGFVVPSECSPFNYFYDGGASLAAAGFPVGTWAKRNDYKTMHWSPVEMNITGPGRAELERLRKASARRHLSVVSPPTCAKQCPCAHCDQPGPCRLDEGHKAASCLYLCPAAFGELDALSRSGKS